MVLHAMSSGLRATQNSLPGATACLNQHVVQQETKSRTTVSRYDAPKNRSSAYCVSYSLSPRNIRYRKSARMDDPLQHPLYISFQDSIKQKRYIDSIDSSTTIGFQETQQFTCAHGPHCALTARLSSDVLLDMETLVICSGAMQGFLYMGAVMALEEYGMLKNLKHIVGASAGAMHGMAYLASKYNKDAYFHVYNSPSDLKVHISNVLETNGFIDTSTWVADGEKIMGGNFTFQEFYDKTNVEFIVSVFNMQKYKTEYISYKTHPDLKVLDIVIASCTIPIVMKTHVENLVDGAFDERVPILPWMDKKKTTILALEWGKWEPPECSTIQSMATSIFSYFWYKRSDNSDGFTKIYLPIYKNKDCMDFQWEVEEKIKCSIAGYKALALLHSKSDHDAENPKGSAQCT